MLQLMSKGPNRRRPRLGLNRAARHNIPRNRLVLAVCIACGVFAIVSFTPAMAEEIIAGKTGTIRAEVMDSFSIKELWHSHRASSFRSQHTVFVVYRASNHENEPIDGEWESPGFVMFGLGDIDETPFAIRIWTKGEDRFLEDLSRKETKGGEDGVALFGPSDDNVRLRITAKPYRKVLVDGEAVGWIDDRDEG